MKVLVIRLSALGDVVLTSGLLNYIKQSRPDISIDLLTSSAFKELWTKNQDVDGLFTVPKGAKSREVADLAQSLPPYDYIFDLQHSLKSFALRRHLEGEVFRVKKNALARRLFVRCRWGRKYLKKHVVEKYAAACLPPLNLPIPPIEKLRPRLPETDLQKLERFDLPQNYVVIHPFASQKNKEWPHIRTLVDILVEKKLPLVVIGQGKQTWPREVIDLSGKTTIAEAAALILGARTLLTTDSGPMHLGIAANTPTLALFGPTTKELGFYPHFKNSFVFENKELSCRPCHIHGGNVCPRRHFKCMREIAPQQVAQKVLQTFEKSST